MSLAEVPTAELIQELERRHREPVMPVSFYCDALRTWARVVQENKYVSKQFGEFLDDFDLYVSKSSLLGRLIYSKEKLRTKKCPLHEGHWNGQAMMRGDCPHKCSGTGWLQEECLAVSDTDRAPAPDDLANFASAVYPIVEECQPTPRDPIAQPAVDPDADVEPSIGDEPQ